MGLIIASHWFAYHRGEKHGDQDFRAYGLQAVAKGELRELRAQVAILRVMVKHPDRFSQSQIMATRIRSDGILKGGKNLIFHYLKTTGDEDQMQEVRSLLDEGEELFAKLPK